MPQISVDTVLFYKGDSDQLPVEKQLNFEGINKRFSGLRLPSNGLTFLYGHKNPGLNHLIGLGPLVGLEAIKVEATVDIQKWIKHKVTLADDPERGLAYSRFLSFSRATREVISAIDEACQEEPGVSIFGDSGVVDRPDLLDSLTTNDAFKHLWVIAYTVDTKEVGRMQVATVFNTDAIEDVEGSSVLDVIELII
ncbi:hypothetical protein LCGC14_0327940 [marine sediment metagenome]|uniref:Uncharacterized protein n=1 Tax=marine sediment metagenome TaxID=412755 RepID=A0A0F9TH70_9ZZZZ